MQAKVIIPIYCITIQIHLLITRHNSLNTHNYIIPTAKLQLNNYSVYVCVYMATRLGHLSCGLKRNNFIYVKQKRNQIIYTYRMAASLYSSIATTWIPVKDPINELLLCGFLVQLMTCIPWHRCGRHEHLWQQFLYRCCCVILTCHFNPTALLHTFPNALHFVSSSNMQSALRWHWCVLSWLFRPAWVKYSQSHITHLKPTWLSILSFASFMYPFWISLSNFSCSTCSFSNKFFPAWITLLTSPIQYFALPG